MGWWEDTHPEIKVEKKRKPQCKRKVINLGRINLGRKIYRAFGPKTRHWPNLRHNDAACGAWGTWRIPAGGLAHRKCDVTCKKCRRLCGLDGGPDLRKVVPEADAVVRRQKQTAARSRRWAKTEAQAVLDRWRSDPNWEKPLVEHIAEALLKAKGCRR